MNDFKKIRQKIIFDTLDRFPNHGNHTISKIIYRDYPEYFTTLESARCAIRYYRGAAGVVNREKLTTKKYVRKPV